MKNKYIILSEKKWHEKLFNNLEIKYHLDEWLLIKSKENFNTELIESFNPSIIFIPHWSYIINKEIYFKYKCIVFHMTDLPFGRGGSPLQNLILLGFKSTKISALLVNNGIDTGDIYLKKTLNLNGSAKQIFIRATFIIQKMIIEIIDKKLTPNPQIGKIVNFSRRKPNESNIKDINNLDKLYDFIRMLDCEGYPYAFYENTYFKFEFTNVKKSLKNFLYANIRITKK